MNLLGPKSVEMPARTIGVVTGFSFIKIGGWNLPIAEYTVHGQTYTVKVPKDIAKSMEHDSSKCINTMHIANHFGTRVSKRLSKLRGCEVVIAYNPKRPKQSKVLSPAFHTHVNTP